MERDLVNRIEEMEAIADLLIDRAGAFKQEAHKARMKLVGVSTPAARKGLDQKAKALLIANRNGRLKSK